MSDDTRALMAELQEVAREGLRPEHELTIAARAKEWDIFSPDWEFLLEHPALAILSLCALSVGLHPYFADPAWVLHVAIPAMALGGEAGEDVADAEPKLRLFLQRCSVAMSHVRAGGLRVLPSQSAAALPEVATDEFGAWASGLGWALPHQFVIGLRDSDASNPGPDIPAEHTRSSVSGGTVKRWTDEAKEELSKYRKAHGTKAAAEHFGISTGLIRQLLPGEASKAPIGMFDQLKSKKR